MPVTSHESLPAWVSASVHQNSIGLVDGTCRRRVIGADGRAALGSLDRTQRKLGS